MQHFGIAMPASPLPDSAQLEAGIIEDENASRLSRVQDNVRHLLRTSVFGSVASSPTTPVRPHLRAAASSPKSPTLRRPRSIQPLRSHPPSPDPEQRTRPARTRFPVVPSPPEVLPSSGDFSTCYSAALGDFPDPPAASYHRNAQQSAHRSALFNTRAVATLNHPDLSDPSMEDLCQQKSLRLQQDHVRIRHPVGSSSSYSTRRRSKRAARRATRSQGLLCVVATLLLAALIATYVALATTIESMSTIFHVLFILGIILATVVFSHTAIRFFLSSRRRSRTLPTLTQVTRHHGRREVRRRRGHLHLHIRHMPSLVDEHDDAYVPPAPIRVHVPGDEVRADPVVALPAPAIQSQNRWSKDVRALPNPPPAYGKWRDSVRANPDLLHWAPSPTIPNVPTLPSPAYEETMALEQDHTNRSHPPSYMTRDSSALRREVQDARARITYTRLAEPEMMETRAVGVIDRAV